MQLSFDKDSIAHQVRITLTDEPLSDGCSLQVVVENRAGGVLASAGKRLRGSEVELLPQMLHLMALGWIYLDARAVTADAGALLAEHRHSNRLGGKAS